MQFKKNVPLSGYSTMRLGGPAHALVEIHSKQDLKTVLDQAEQDNMPVIMIGEGSNIVWNEAGFQGIVIVNKLSGMEQVSEDDVSVTFKIAAGEEWDKIAGELTAKNLSGIEALSLIPGTTGATPVQNVGAYGQDISQTLVSVEAYDNSIKEFVVIENKDCGFGYRTSRFKTTDKGRFFITSITLKLKKAIAIPPFYATLEAYLAAHNITSFTPQTIRDAVIAIRKEKMPDWHITATNGSFFANPIVDVSTYEKLKSEYPGLVAWDHEGQHKISAGWLIEKAGLKGFHDPETGMATSEKSALVVINEHARSTADLNKFTQKIIDTVQAKFGITLEPEPELLP